MELLVLLLIIANCIVLGFESNRPGFATSKAGKTTMLLEIAFLAFFTFEVTLKMIAYGCFTKPEGYFRNGWNILDFAIVVLGWITLVPSVGNYSSLRAIRVLRSLRTITAVPDMRKLVGTLLKSMPMLLDVLILCAFGYFIFGIIGVQIFSGVLTHRCGCPSDALAIASPFNIVGPNNVCRRMIVTGDVDWVVKDGRIHALNEDDVLVKAFQCPSKTSANCMDGLICADVGNPHHGIVSFDNILWAWLTIFQLISLEGWTEVCYMVQEAVSPASWIYFFVLIVFGSFFAINLALAVLYLHFTSANSQSDCSMASDRSTIGVPTSSRSAYDVAPVTARTCIQRWCLELQKSRVMEILTTTLIVVNIAIMAANHYGMPQWQKEMEETVNMIVAIYFLVEMVIKVTGLSWRGYFKDRMNQFDAVIVVAGMIEFVVSLSHSTSGIGGWIYVLRVFRLMRIFKLSRSWHELNKIVTTVQGSIGSMAYLSCLFFLFVVVMALLGMQIFGYKMRFCNVPGSQALCPPGRLDCPDHPDCYVQCNARHHGQWIPIYGSPYNGQAYCEAYEGETYWAQVGPSHVPRHNFDSFFWSFISVFQILTGENWNEVMYDLMQSTSYFAAIYCLQIIVIGNYILLNLFLAILLENYASAEDDRTMITAEIEAPLIGEEHDIESHPVSHSTEVSMNESRSGVTDDQRSPEEIPSTTVTLQSELPSTHSLTGRALFLFSPQNPLRQMLTRIVYHRSFEYVIGVIILASSIVLALESPSLDEQSVLARAIKTSDTVFVTLFAIEATLKMIVAGFLFNGPGSYLRDKWNVLDFAILIVGVIFQFRPDLNQLKSPRVLRALRCLRPLRLATRNKGLRVVINSLFKSVLPLLNVALVCLLFFMTFAILGVNLLKGKFYYCADEDDAPLDPSIIGQSIDKEWCLEGHHSINSSAYHRSINISIPSYDIYHKWKNRESNFDFIGAAMLTLFEMGTLEMWLDVMYNGIDAVGVNKQPIRDNNQLAATFFIAFIVIGAFFVLNLFVSVTIDKFQEIKYKQEGRMYLLTKEQEEWVLTQRYLWVARPRRHYVPPKGTWRRLIFDGVSSTAFEILVMLFIFINVIAMSCSYQDMNPSFHDTIKHINFACTIFFVVEVIVKLIAFGFRNYFQDRWNVFDFVVTVVSFVGSPMLVPANVPIISVFRVFRVTRLLRLIPKATGLRTLFQTLMFSLPALLNVGGILSLFFFIYAVVGMQLFGTVKRGAFLDSHANFEDFGHALLTLFRMATGESWNGLMHDAMIDTDCKGLPRNFETDNTLQYSGTYFSNGDDESHSTSSEDLVDRCTPSKIVTVGYFCSFIIVVAFILLNVVIAVILDNFETSSRREDLTIKVRDIDEYAKAWSEFDPDATWYIPIQKLPLLLLELPPPLGAKGTAYGMSEVLSLILSIQIPDRDSRVHFLETLRYLMDHVVGTAIPISEDDRIREQVFHLLPKDTDTVQYTVAHYHSAKHVQASIRGFLIRERMAHEITTYNLRGLQKLRTMYRLRRD